MRALRFHNFGAGSSVLRIEEILEPTTDARDLLVQVKAAAINPSDVKNAAGTFSQTTLPRTPGRDFSGIVVSTGEHEGEQVWGTGPGLGMIRDGAHAEYASHRARPRAMMLRSKLKTTSAPVTGPYANRSAR